MKYAEAWEDLKEYLESHIHDEMLSSFALGMSLALSKMDDLEEEHE